MKKQMLKDLKARDKVHNLFVAKHKHLEYFRDKSKGQFLTIVLADRSGHLLARAWEHAPSLYKQFEEGDIIAVFGRVEEYMGRLQIIVDKLRPLRPDDRAHYSDDDFVPQTDKDIDVLWQTVSDAAQEVANEHLKRLLELVLADEELAAGLRAAPASKAMHHSYRGGLLEHVVEMLVLARSLQTVYPQLDRDLLITGIIVHDLGLVEGARYELDIDYSDEGRLMGHVVLGERLVAARIAAIADFPAPLALQVSHMILSHHGESDEVTLRPPQTLEAMALYLLNKLSAELGHVQQFLDSQWGIEKPWTDFDRLLGRFFFRGPTHEEPAIPEAPPAEAADSTATTYANDAQAADFPAIAERPAQERKPPATG
jgi:3'-5' exoribonuclease